MFSNHLKSNQGEGTIVVKMNVPGISSSDAGCNSKDFAGIF